MKNKIKEFISQVLSFETDSKAEMISFLSNKFALSQDGTVFFCEHFAIRVSYSKSKSFSNTVLSLSKLQKYDGKPFFVVLVRAKGLPNYIYLANTTFLSKISHSSQQLSQTNIRGSFNGSDIIKIYQGLENCTAETFEALFAFHTLSWEENLRRLVANTNNIVPVGKKFEISNTDKENILSSVDFAAKFLQSEDFKDLSQDLESRLNSCRDGILCAAHIENINIRGRLIEALITSDQEHSQALLEAVKNEEIPTYNTKNTLGDYCKTYRNGTTYTDIKTKILYLHSNPKAYNIDKFLETMSDAHSILLFYLIGIDENGIVATRLVSAYHNALVDATIVQSHWSGRNSRGVTQFRGETLNDILQDKDFVNVLDTEKARTFLCKLMSI